MPRAEAGHGLRMLIEMDPEAAQGTFSLVPQVFNVEWPDQERSYTQTTPTNAGVSDGVLSVPTHTTMPFTLNWVEGNEVHIALESHHHSNPAVIFGLQLAKGDRSVTFSGGLTKFKRADPPREGATTIESEFMPMGPYWVNGTLRGADIF